MKNGIYYDLPKEKYHADEGSTSKSFLWKMHKKTPAHAVGAEPYKPPPYVDMGTALHLALLEPHLAADLIIKGPADRRGNKWKDAKEAAAEIPNSVLVTESDYDACWKVQDIAAKHPIIKQINAVKCHYEASAFFTHEPTGMQVRTRPDTVVPSLGLMVDLKTTADAGPWRWARTAGDIGYHCQEAIYTQSWPAAGGCDISGFVFIVVEQAAPHCIATYELEPSAVLEGAAIFDKTMAMYKKCKESGVWPGYPEEVQHLDIPPFEYRETDKPED